jgi:RNA polymerase sigma factor (sigma-70 family)
MQETDVDEISEKILWFQQVILPCKKGLSARIRRILPSHLDLDDVVAETLARAYAASNWREVTEAPAFLARIARNFLIDQTRREAVVSFEYMADLEQLGPAMSYDGVLDARDELRRLEKVIDRLPAQQRRAFILRRVFGYSIAEVAEEMQLAVSTVERHMTRALVFLTRETANYRDYARGEPQRNQGGSIGDRAGSRTTGTATR